MANLLESGINFLNETLNRPFYSDAERKMEVGRNSFSQVTPPELLPETDVVPGDMSYSYTLGGQLDYIIDNRDKLIKLWRQTSYFPEVDEAIQEILNEALVFEEDDELPFEVNLDDVDINVGLKTKIEKSFEKILDMLDFHMNGQNIFKQWYVDGVLSFEVVYDNKKIKEGIKQIHLLSPFKFFKYKDITTKELIYFYSSNVQGEFDQQGMPLSTMYDRSELKYTPEQIVHITSGIASEDRLYSISPLNKAIKLINQLHLIEDSLVIQRITRAPEKKVFYIDTGRLPKGKAEQYIKNLMMKHRNKMVYNFDTGQIDNRKRSISVLEDYWLPRNAEGRGTEIETLSGQDGDVNSIADLEHIYGRVFKALNVPVQRRDMESSFSAVTANNMDVERDEIKFNRFVVQLRKRFTPALMDFLKKDLIASKVFTLEDWKRLSKRIKLRYKNTNNYAEAKKLTVFAQRMEAAQIALSLAEDQIVTRDWIKKNIMLFSPEEIAENDKSEGDEKDKYGGPPGFVEQEEFEEEEIPEEPEPEPVQKEDE